jgi:DNA ligase-1|tara:strand:- start:340 stop:1479 length:1140 start_codon:yes stop_codon:yes gene_type:complete
MLAQSLQPLYKMDSKGKIRVLTVSYGSDERGSFYEQEHGLLDGKLQTSRTYVAGKNAGKANATTDEEQAEKEAESKRAKKRDRGGYSESIPEDKPMMPMLALTHDKHGHKIKYPAYVQPKLDGIRCFVHVDGESVTLKSRTGKEFTSLDHIADAVRELVSVMGKSVGSFILDGELYNHQFKEDFQGLVSAIKRDKPSENTHLVEFHCYDYVAEDRDFKDRIDELYHMGWWLSEVSTIQIVPTFPVENLDEVVEQNSLWLEDGYEGSMIRNSKGGYQPNRRSPDLQKYKSFMDAEFEIVGAVENKGKMEGQCTFTCVTEDGTEFGCKPMGDESQREQYWIDFQAGKLTGKMLTVKFFEWTTSENPVPRFPVGVIVRDYED